MGELMRASELIKNKSVQQGIKEQKFEKAVDAIVNMGGRPFAGMQAFTDLLNIEPRKEDIKTLNGNKYIPIGIIEARLDQFFFGEWWTEKFQFSREFNEMIGSIELVCRHPVTQKEIRRVGTASIQILQKKNTELSDFNAHKIKNALEAGFPKLKSECIKNAAKSLGNLFGRNLNRDNTANPHGIIKEEEIDLNTTPEDLTEEDKS